LRSFIANYDKGSVPPKTAANGAEAPARRTSKAAAAKPSTAAARRR
jgi:hypothetical protein